MIKYLLNEEEKRTAIKLCNDILSDRITPDYIVNSLDNLSIILDRIMPDDYIYSDLARDNSILIDDILSDNKISKEEEEDGKVLSESPGSDDSEDDVRESTEIENIEEEETEMKRESIEAETNAKEADEDQWLHGMSFDPKGKRPPVCFKFADTGACEYGTKCAYSHNIEDVKAYKAAKLLGPARVSNISSQFSQRASDGRKDSSGPNKNQSGTRKVFDKPTILKRSQDARGHN